MADDRSALDQFTGLELARLDSYEIAVLNLAAARGLPGTQELNPDDVLDTLDDWAERVKLEICRHLYRFDLTSFQAPTEFSYGNSLGRFFCWFLLQVLQEDCGVAYHPDRKFKPDFCKPEDLFIHGIVGKDGRGGTCASMPVVYVAVGQRLGLPVYLVESRGHLFFRWDSPHGCLIDWSTPTLRLWIPPDRFNIEGSGEGIAYYPDSHYIQWPELWTEADFEHGEYLRSMTPTEVLASFLIQRAECFHDLGDRNESMKAIYFARQLCPNNRRYEWLHAKRTHELRDHERSMTELHARHLERQAARRALPGIQGHSRNCCCGNCETLRDIAEALPAAPHGGTCQCHECRNAVEATTALRGVPGHSSNCPCHLCDEVRRRFGFQPRPPHGDYCQCFACLEARNSASAPQGLPGHHLNCRCKGCLAAQMIPRPGVPFRQPVVLGVPATDHWGPPAGHTGPHWPGGLPFP